jgi:hypothetical protein
MLNCYSGTTQSVNQYRAMGTIRLSWTDGTGKAEKIFTRFADIVSHIKQTRSFQLKLPPPPNWLDLSVAVAKPDGPIVSTDGTKHLPFTLPSFGKDFPVTPTIDREGAAFSSFHSHIQSNILRLHARVIDACDLAFNLDDMTWFHDLRMLVNECVTAVDMTLHQLYIKAEFGPRPEGWRFDRAKLGPSHGVRLKDKLKWIGQITGRPLDDARDEVASLTVIKGIRNHWNHFDPPCLAFTMEDVVFWLKRVPDIGRLLWKMRQKMGLPLSGEIVEIIMLPLAVFIAKDPSAPRVPQGDDVGYRSSCWPLNHPHVAQTSHKPRLVCRVKRLFSDYLRRLGRWRVRSRKRNVRP